MAGGQGRDGRNSDTKASNVAVSGPTISLLKGGGAIRGRGEKFSANPVSGILYAIGVEPIDSSHLATGAITALLATTLIYLSKWPLQPLDLSTASAFAGLLVAVGGALVKYYKSRTALSAPSVAPVVPIAPPNLVQEPPIAA